MVLNFRTNAFSLWPRFLRQSKYIEILRHFWNLKYLWRHFYEIITKFVAPCRLLQYTGDKAKMRNCWSWIESRVDQLNAVKKGLLGSEKCLFRLILKYCITLILLLLFQFYCVFLRTFGRDGLCLLSYLSSGCRTWKKP